MLLHMKNSLATRYNLIYSKSASTQTMVLFIFGLGWPINLTAGLFYPYFIIYHNTIIIIVI